MKTNKNKLIFIILLVSLVLITFFVGRSKNWYNYRLINNTEYEDLKELYENSERKVKVLIIINDSLNILNSELEEKLKRKPQEILEINKKYEKIFNNIRKLSPSDQLKFFTREIEKWDSIYSIIEVGFVDGKSSPNNTLGQRGCNSYHTKTINDKQFVVVR